MNPQVDDIGSFPFPKNKNKEDFNKAYQLARQAVIDKKDLSQDQFIKDNFNSIILDAFKKKLACGLDCVNFPQMYSGLKQITDQIHVAMANGSFTVDTNKAVLPEIQLINQNAKQLSEEFGKKISLRVCIFGPMDLYMFEVGKKVYPDVLEGYIETVKRFAKNSIINNKYIQTTVVSIDEPSLGYNQIEAKEDFILDVLEKTYDFKDVTKQIHLHSTAKIGDLLKVKNLDVVAYEAGANPKNIEAVPKKMLDSADKHIRVGISRTDIDTILAELSDKGIKNPSAEQIVEPIVVIQKKFLTVKEKYGERLSFVGPDCGLNGWPTQEAAELLLSRTVKAVKTAP